MAELTRIVEWKTRYPKEWKIVRWTWGMAVAVFLITYGKAISEHPLQHLLIGAALGFVLGLLFSRNQKARSDSK
jgi:hypothetical protein